MITLLKKLWWAINLCCVDCGGDIDIHINDRYYCGNANCNKEV